MLFLRFLLVMFLSFVSTNILSYFLGRILFTLGLKKLGHRLVSMSIAGDFNHFKKIHLLIFLNCPYDSSNTCKLWPANTIVNFLKKLVSKNISNNEKKNTLQLKFMIISVLVVFISIGTKL